MGFPGGSEVNNSPVVQETQVRSLGWEEPLEKEMATNSSILAWRIPWTEGPGGCSPWGHKESNMTEQLNNNSNYHIYCLETISLLSKSKWKKKKKEIDVGHKLTFITLEMEEIWGKNVKYCKSFQCKFLFWKIHLFSLH